MIGSLERKMLTSDKDPLFKRERALRVVAVHRAEEDTILMVASVVVRLDTERRIVCNVSRYPLFLLVDHRIAALVQTLCRL